MSIENYNYSKKGSNYNLEIDKLDELQGKKIKKFVDGITKETTKLNDEIIKIGGYKFDLNKEKKEFSIEINEVHTLTVKYEDGEFIFIDNIEGYINGSEVEDFSLEENETLKGNENVNTLNKLIKFYSGYESEKGKGTINNEEDLKKAAKLFEAISE